MSVFVACTALFMWSLYSYFSEERQAEQKAETAYVAAAVEEGGKDFLQTKLPKDSANRITWIDRDGTVLAYTDEDGQRRYNNSADTRKAVCQVIGDSGGKVSTGADTFHAQFLLGFRSSIFERLADAFTGTTQRGDDVRLTISERLSRYISEQFPKGKRGAVVVLNYKTNEILAMVSMPQFDPTNMDAALANESAGALINRPARRSKS